MNDNEDSEPNYTIEAFDSLLKSHNDNSSNLDQAYQSIDGKSIDLENIYFDDYSTKKKIKFSLGIIIGRFFDLIWIILLIVCLILIAAVFILMIIEFSFSFYSVIIVNYVFFISTIISYGMAPIYKSLSHDWLNMVVSFAQVILASPLIAFFIFFILKSVISLVEFLADVPVYVKNGFSILKNFINPLFDDCISEFYFDSEAFVSCLLVFTMIPFLLVSSILFALFAGLGYALFFFDKTIIVIGAVQYIFVVIQIFLLAFPSYVYFFQTLFGIKCKKNKLVESYICWVKKIIEKIDEKSNIKKTNKKSDENKVNEENEENEANEANEENKENEESEDTKKRIIDDELIPELKTFDEVIDSKFVKFYNFVLILLADEYFSLYYFSLSIAFDRHKQYRKRICMLIFFILNLLVIIYDIYKLTQDYSDYLLFSVIIRFIIVPFFSYYNIVTVLYHKAKDNTLKIVNYVSVIFTVLIIAVIAFGSIYSHVYQQKYRIKDLEYFPPLNNVTIANEKLITHPICSQYTNDISAFEAFGYSLGGFDVKRNKKIFENQMKTFFGENYADHISYTIHDVDKYFFVLKYYDSTTDSHIYAFRGYTSGPEIAFQFELFVSYYVIPFFDDIIPLYEIINDNWLGFYTNFFHSFGIRFFDNRNLIVKYANSIISIYEKENFDENANVIFTGINSGGVMAKIVGTLVYRKSISFLSFPMGMDVLEHLFHYSTTFMSHVTNVFNIDGFFSHPDSDHTVNIGIDVPIFTKSKYCTADMCEMFSKADNIYKTFCTMSETCGKGNQFKKYCEQVIGENNLEIIRKSLEESD